ncbi:hypothetical protein CYY_002403 [Polysphondylium violaceum]|uniref:Uncharacterized protein n=1 Tax=Polysphondylium violaceum TaxID=133409 RepID=A0A8J4V2W9_9MYCE|nr:hypothetical protein CYY_002403 [Polysphondylium violaceum]
MVGGKRGRPPKNRPSNTVDDSGRSTQSIIDSHLSTDTHMTDEMDDSDTNSTSRHHDDYYSATNSAIDGHEGTLLSTSPNGDKDTSAAIPNSMIDNSGSSNNNNSDGWNLYLPSIDLVPKILENGYISKLSSMSTEPYQSDSEVTTSTTLNTENIDISPEDLDNACNDVFLFKRYIKDTKRLIEDQIYTLEQWKSMNYPNTTTFQVERQQYEKYKRKPRIKRRPIHTDPHSGTESELENDVLDKSMEDSENTTYTPTTTSLNSTTTSSNPSNSTATATTTTSIIDSSISANKNNSTKNKRLQKPYRNESDEDIDIVEVDDLSNRKKIHQHNNNVLNEDDNDSDSNNNSNNTSMPTSTTTTTTTTSTTNPSKNKRIHQPPPPSKNNKKKSGSKYQDDVHKKKKRDEVEAYKVHIGPGVFWNSIDSYFKPITDTDIEFITPKPDEFYNPYFAIPPLGTHYSEVWYYEDQERLNGKSSESHSSKHRNISRARSEMDGTPPPPPPPPNFDEGIFISTDEICMGDLSMRLLSALIEDNTIISTSTNTFSASSSGNIKFNQPLASSYSENNQLCIEQRIQMELASLGIYDDYKVPTSIPTLNHQLKEKDKDREDDEISYQIRLLQNQLRAQLETNNQLKLKALAECKSVISLHDSLRRKKNSQTNNERNYQKLMKRDKKKRRVSKPT